MPGLRATGTLLLLGLATLHGCASRGNVHVLEHQLRMQEDQVRTLRSELDVTQKDLASARYESQRLRSQLASAGQQSHSPEHLANEFRAVGIAFNSYLTSGVDRDGLPGDEMLSIMVYPHDDKGGIVRLAGQVEIRLIDPGAETSAQQIGQWSFSPTETRAAWHSGLLATGFLFEMPWQTLPSSDELTLHVEFKSTDGRTFDETQQIQIRPPADVTGKAPVSIETRKPADDLPPDPEALDGNPAPADGRIDTSDRYREWELPQIR